MGLSGWYSSDCRWGLGESGGSWRTFRLVSGPGAPGLVIPDTMSPAAGRDYSGTEKDRAQAKALIRRGNGSNQEEEELFPHRWQYVLPIRD